MPLGLSQLSGTAQYMRRVEGVPLPETLTPTAYAVFVVDDVDAAVERVRAAGGHVGGVKDQPCGRIAACMDTQGLAFSLQQRVPMPGPPSTGAREGDPAYIVFEFPDAARAQAFFITRSWACGSSRAAGLTAGTFLMSRRCPVSAVVHSERRWCRCSASTT
jgi:hypothetical protein